MRDLHKITCYLKFLEENFFNLKPQCDFRYVLGKKKINVNIKTVPENHTRARKSFNELFNSIN